MKRDLTRGPVTKSMLLFAIPMILGDLLQQDVYKRQVLEGCQGLLKELLQ